MGTGSPFLGTLFFLPSPLELSFPSCLSSPELPALYSHSGNSSSLPHTASSENTQTHPLGTVNKMIAVDRWLCRWSQLELGKCSQLFASGVWDPRCFRVEHCVTSCHSAPSYFYRSLSLLIYQQGHLRRLFSPSPQLTRRIHMSVDI